MANLPMEITGVYRDTLVLPVPEQSGFAPVQVKPWEGIESTAGLAARATRIVRHACPLGTLGCEADVEIERSGVGIKNADLICLADTCPIDCGQPEGFERTSETEGRLRQLDSVRPTTPKRTVGESLIIGSSEFVVHVEEIKDSDEKK